MADGTGNAGASLSDGDVVIADKAASSYSDATVHLLLFQDKIHWLKQQHLSDLSALQAKLTGTETELKEMAGHASRLEEQLRISQANLSSANAAKSINGHLSASLYAVEIRKNRLEEQLSILQDDIYAAKLAKASLEKRLSISQDDLFAVKLANIRLHAQLCIANIIRLEEQLRISQEDLSATEIKQTDELLELDSSVENTPAMQIKINDLERTIELLEEELEASKQRRRQRLQEGIKDRKIHSSRFGG